MSEPSFSELDVPIDTNIEKEKPSSKVLRGMPDFFEIEATERGEQIDSDKNPEYVMINLDTNCGMQCPKCAEPGQGAAERGKSLSNEERTAILDLAAEIGVKELVVVGTGEPTKWNNYINQVKPAIEAAYERKMGTVLFTTAIGLTQEQAEFYRDHDVTVIVSLDSLDPANYARLVGHADKPGASNILPAVLEHIRILRETYAADSAQATADGRSIVRLGVNVTVQGANVDELEAIRDFAGDDMMFIANVLMPEGRARRFEDFEKLVGEKGLDALRKRAAEMSDTGGHSSLANEVCSYFNRGISVDTDGRELFCGYDSQTHKLGNIQDHLSAQEVLQRYQEKRTVYRAWCEQIGQKPSCPNRVEDTPGQPSFAEFLDEWRERQQPES